ncbi:ThuA domain-containing protein [Natranaeroarchaeum aerophilus]|uniref:ThuA domain-containing protein n=1 Tax=Natranaeroarchaeum aerophilus TaxID=2917711 RepID=A0AAE3FSV0_9EURY|nr:ThuA domain-containing protein [Natranaeroarchaeum aerophilus]MCL9814293.1 ThuA domain-containing protein [Natranaeroarchaeum aerophilus]
MTQPHVLLVGETRFPFHSLDEMGPHIEDALGETTVITSTTDRSALTDLSAYDIVVDYLTDSALTDEQRAGLFSFIESGGGYLGLHCAADLTSQPDGDGSVTPREEPLPELRAFLGGHFLGHPEQAEFGVEIVEREHPIIDGVSDFRVFDEPYKLAHDEDVEVLAWMDHEELDRYPVVWTKTHGAGRICYASLGHTPEALEQPSYRRLLRNAVGWLAEQ